jgi:hypothetical protein
MVRRGRIDYRPSIQLLTEAVIFSALTNRKGFERMANDLSGLNAALDAVAQGVADVAAAIANPPAGGNDQAALDAAAARLNDLAAQLSAAKVAEDAEDAAG